MPPADDLASPEGVDLPEPIAALETTDEADLAEPNSPLKKPTLARSASEDSKELDPRLRVGLVLQRAAKPRAPFRNVRTKIKRSSFGLPPFFCALATALAVVALGLGGFKLFTLARTHVHEQDRYQIATRDIEVTPLPVWLHSDLLAQVQKLAGLPDTLNTLDPGLAEEIHDAFLMHPWVHEVVEVRVTHPAILRVKLNFREPVAVVQTTRCLEAVDRNGVLLPATELPDLQLYLTITGVRSTPTGPAGSKWEDTALAAAIATADAVSLYHRKLGLTTIDVSTYQSTGSKPGYLSLLTEQGTKVKWGRAPGTDCPGEVPVEDKIDRLLQYVTDNGSLDKPSGPYEIDVTHWQEISIRPRSSTTAPVRRAAARTTPKR